MNLSEKLLFITCLNLFFSLINCSSILARFKEFRIVPEIISLPPKSPLRVSYSQYEADFGNEMPPSAASNPPDLEWNANPDNLYSLFMIDTDYPGTENLQLFHWVVGNIPGKDLSKGELLVSYNNPQPPKGKGPHLYIFLIFNQPGKIDYTHNLFLDENRIQPSLRGALQFYKIDDRPFAGNFFLSQNE